MLSLDEWCNTVTRGILMDALESALIFIIFIFVANYILLNVMLAIACSEIMCKDDVAKRNPAEKPVKIKKNALNTVLTKLLSLISFQHKYLFNKIQGHYHLNRVQTEKKLHITETEINSFYFLKKLLLQNSSHKKKSEINLVLQYKNKRITCKRLDFLEINKNVEIFAEENKENIENIETKQDKTMSSQLSMMSDEQDNYFEIELPTIQKKSLPTKIKEFTQQLLRIFTRSEKKQENFENFFS